MGPEPSGGSFEGGGTGSPHTVVPRVIAWTTDGESASACACAGRASAHASNIAVARHRPRVPGRRSETDAQAKLPHYSSNGFAFVSASEVDAVSAFGEDTGPRGDGRLETKLADSRAGVV